VATNVIMPALGMAQETGKVLRWFKGEGDTVSKGEPLLEIETDKATVELEAPASGILAGMTAVEGDVVPIGQVIAEILAPGEAPRAPSAAPSPTSIPAGLRESSAGVAADSGQHQTTATGRPPEAAKESRRPLASPKARRMAREQGVDLSRVQGSGPGGAVLASDVVVTAETTGKTAAPQGVRASPVGTVWRLMAERTTSAWTTVPHFFLLREMNAGRLAAWRESCRRRFNSDVTYSDLLVKLVAAALRKHPRLNAMWEDGAVVHNDEINIGLAVAREDGLIVPVIHAADRLGVSEITRQRTDLVRRARAGKARPEDLRGGTFTISNLGMYGVDAFTAIINAPQAAILAVGRVAERVVPVEGKPGVQAMVTLSLSCDHRVADGARAAQFLETLAELIEEPASLVE